MVERLGKMRKERGLRKGAREDRIFFFFLDPALRYSHCFFKSSGYDKLELKHQNVDLTSL